MPDDLYDEALEHRRVRDAALQGVVDDVVRRSVDRPVPEIRLDLERTLAERGLPPMPEGWLEAVSSAAAVGDPYIVSTYSERADDVPPTRHHEAPGTGIS
ncbi:MAG TPA: hypothetical protein VFL46_02030 [Phycicoccus sp.]|nr:hypothetical protein [Phycicoccus sp.]